MKILSLYACSLLAACVLADDITCEKYPDADVVTVEEIERVRYNSDGTYEQTDESWTKILTEKGRRSESTFSMDYSKRYGEASVLFVGAIDSDGQEREIDVSATTKDSTDNSAMASNIYDPLDRRIACSIPGLRIGETVHVKTMRKATRPRCQDKWADLAVMEWSHPILKSTYEVTAPASRPLQKIAIRHPLGNIISNMTELADGSIVYTFTATNSAQAFPEPDMPPLYTQVQNVRVSTAKDWQEISRWYWSLCAPHIARTNAAMLAKVRELTSPDDGSDHSLHAIFKFVSQEVRYMGLTMEDLSPGYAPHDVDITFDHRYGVCRDKAGLLVAMLRLAGFRAFPVLIHVGAKLDPEVPQPFFNHAIVAVDQSDNSTGRRYLLMDPTNENTKDLLPAYLGNRSYLVARPEGEDLRTSPVEPSEHNEMNIVSSATLARDGSMFFEGTIDFKGINDTAYRGTLVKRTPEERQKTFERIAKLVSPGAELVKCEIEPRDLRDTSVPLAVKLAARFPEMVIRGETRDELTVPTLSKTLGLANWLLQGSTALEHRRYVLEIDSTACVRERLTLNLAGALGGMVELPPDERIFGGYNYARTFVVTNGVLTMNRSLAVSAVEFEPEAYRNLREEIKRVEAAERRRPVFAADFTHDADVRRHLDSSETTLFSDTSWVTTNTDVHEVLTYKGKRDVAEMKFDFHPSWKNVEIVEATVSNRNGRVYAVSPKEINDMDIGWASMAPRYPAGKLRIVNLPSVEIGSVVSVKTVVTVTNAPAPFYACCYFDSYQPVDHLVRRVDDFRRDISKVKRLADEPAQPHGLLWRDCEIITRGDWVSAAASLREATDVAPLDPAVLRLSNGSSLRALRDWMAKYVKLVGPSLYEVPLAQQLTDPEVILKERYATRLDYIRTLCALLRGVGFTADVVFAANNAKSPERVRELCKTEKPDIRAYSTALCRVRERTGGFLWWGGETKEYFLGAENEYTPIGATGYDGCDYFDPADGTFGVVRNSSEEFRTHEAENSEIRVRENGAVDISVRNSMWGSQVGAYRKRFSEILPEMRSRFYQSLLGDIAQAASATGDLVTDTKGYPATTGFSCFVPDYATVGKDAISIVLPAFDEVLPNLTGTARETPLAVEAADSKTETVSVTFPEGYTEIEHLPSPLSFRDWLYSEVTTGVTNNVLTVTVRRTTAIPAYTQFEPVAAELIKDVRRRFSSRANRTIVVRRR